MEEPVVAFARTTGPRRPPPARDAGVYAPVPLVLRVASAVASILAVVASALLWVAELVDSSGSTAQGVSPLFVTALLAAAGVPLLFAGPLGKSLPTRERRLGIAVAGLLPALCWVAACWPAIAAARGWS